ncbi:MAG TPA: tetratricopeptide repeat protein [Polyangiaceae bacterium]
MQGGPGDRGRNSDYRYRATTPDATEDFLFHLYRGSELLQDNRVHEAKEELEQALRLQPRDAKGQDLLAVVYFRLGLYPRAIEIYEELMREFPRDGALTQNLALCYLKTGQPDKARTLLENLVLSQPDHLRAWAYLGLVHERLGDYEKARTAFERGQQPGMARRMEDLLAIAAPPRSLSVPAPYSVPGTSEPKPPPEAFHDLDRESTLVGLPTVAATSAVPPPPPLPTESLPSPPQSAPPPTSRNGPAAVSFDEGLANAPSFAPISRVSVGAPAASALAEVATLSQLTRESMLAFPQEPGLAALSNGLVLVHVQASFAARLSGIHLMAADAHGFKGTALARKMRNRSLDEPLGGHDSPLVSLAGHGYLALAPSRDERLLAFQMEGDFLFLREAILVGFEESLTYENGRLAAFEGEAVALVQLRGRGGVVLRTKGAVIATEVRTDKSAVLVREAILGWAGRLLPRELSPDEAPGGAPGLISFAGDGTVLAGIGAGMVQP